MKDLPSASRVYVCFIYLTCLVAAIAQIGALGARSISMAVLCGSAVVLALAYLGQWATLEIDGAVKLRVVPAVYIAAILLLPPPFAVAVTLLAAVAWQATRGRAAWYRRSFDVCRSTLVVALSSALLGHLAGRSSVFHTGHLGTGLAILAALIALYYLLDTALMLGLAALAQRRSPREVWRRTCAPLLSSDLALLALGVVGAALYHYNALLLALLAVPVVALWQMALRNVQADQRARALRQRTTQLELVLAAGQRAQLQQTQVDLLLPVTEAARSIAGASVATAYLRNDEDPPLLERVALAPADAPAAAVGPARMLVPPVGQGTHEYEEETGHTLLLPLELESCGVVGMLWLAGLPGTLNHDDMDVLSMLGTQTAMALQNARLHERALLQASEDGLTALLNHRAFQVSLGQEVTRAQRDGHPLTLMMVDLDNFGQINNTYGHQTGDAALMAVAGALRESVRAGDVVARYGGDEFAVILPQTDMDEALAIARRTHAALAALTVIEPSAIIRINSSVGVAALPVHANTREDLVRAADQAAYAAKQAGKGRVARPEDAPLKINHDFANLLTQLKNANMATVEALAAAVDAKDPYTRGHSQRVSAYGAAIAEAMGLSAADVARVRLAGLLHDVGKIGVPDAILTKPGRLTDEEFAVLKQHPIVGERMIGAVPYLRETRPAVRHHHEQWDGSGYPDGIAEAAIPLDARILMLADSFDAMTSSRTYRPALPLQEARRRVIEGSGTQFDPDVVTAFERALTEGKLRLQSAGGTKKLSRERVA